MNSITQQIVTVISVLLGAIATFAFTSLNERAKWRRSTDSRWDDKRLNAYSEYAAVVKRYSQLAGRLSAARGYPSDSPPIGLEEGMAQLHETAAERTVKWETVLLLGAPEAVAAARQWVEATWALGRVARGEIAVGHDEFLEIYATPMRRRDPFYRAARGDLGVRGDLPSWNRAYDPKSGLELGR